MTIDEAIKHAEEVAEENQVIVDACDYYGGNMAKCEKCAKEHRQLVEWLKDYKQLKEQGAIIDKIRAEIEQDAIKSVFGTKYIFVNRVNQIFDKYKAESEV